MEGRSSLTATGGNRPQQRSLLHDEFKETLIQDSKVKKSSSTEWTDEKHSLYLKSIEASFVEELYSSLDLFGFHSQGEKLLHPLSSHQRKQHTPNISSGQYKVLRGGCWGKIEFASQKSRPSKENQSNGLSQNPWIRHFRPTNTNKAVTSRSIQETQYTEVPVCSKLALNTAPLPATSNQLHLRRPNFCHHDSLCCDTEGTDQNFEDDHVDGEKEASAACCAKKMKTSVAATPSRNQVVPHSMGRR